MPHPALACRLVLALLPAALLACGGGPPAAAFVAGPQPTVFPLGGTTDSANAPRPFEATLPVNMEPGTTYGPNFAAYIQRVGGKPTGLAVTFARVPAALVPTEEASSSKCLTAPFSKTELVNGARRILCKAADEKSIAVLRYVPIVPVPAEAAPTEFIECSASHVAGAPFDTARVEAALDGICASVRSH